MPWQQILISKGGPNGFYIALRTLLSVDPEPKIYDKSSTYYGSSQSREICTPPRSSSRSRLIMRSPSATLSGKSCTPLEVQNISSPYNKDHTDYIFDSSSSLQTAELSRSLKLNISSSSSSASHLNFICESSSPTHSSDLKPSNSRSIIITTSTRSQITKTKRSHSSELD